MLLDLWPLFEEAEAPPAGLPKPHELIRPWRPPTEVLYTTSRSRLVAHIRVRTIVGTRTESRHAAHVATRATLTVPAAVRATASVQAISWLSGQRITDDDELVLLLLGGIL